MIQPSMNESQQPSSYVVEDFIYDPFIARQVEKNKLMCIKNEATKLTTKLVADQGRCKICTLVPPCQHIKTISHEKQYALISKFMNLTKNPAPKPLKPLKSRRQKSVLPPRPDNVKQMLTNMNYAVDNNKVMSKEELFEPKPRK